MDPFVVGILAIFLMIGLTFLGVPIALALLAVGSVGNFYLMGFPQTAMQINMITWETGTKIVVAIITVLPQLVLWLYS